MIGDERMARALLRGRDLVRKAVGVAVALLLVLGCGSAPPGPTLRARYGLRPPDAIVAPRTAVVLVDVQREFVDGVLALPDAPASLGRIRALLAWARAHGVLVVHVRQRGAEGGPLFAPGTPGAAPLLAREDGEIVVEKRMAGAFSGTELDALLRARGTELVVVAGWMTHLAIDTTARDATVLGYRVVVVSDATATRALPALDGTAIDAHAVQRTALAALADRFADVMTTDAIASLALAPEVR